MDAKAEAAAGDEEVPEAPEQTVALVSAGANHSVALLCKQPPPPHLSPSRRLGWEFRRTVESTSVIHLTERAFVASKAVCSWGRGEDGQLGHGDAEDRPVPTLLSGFDVPGIASVVICGADHTTAYSDEQMQLYSWGWYVPYARRRLPLLLLLLQGIDFSRPDHIRRLLICRGDFGRLGHGNSSDVFHPQPIEALQGIKIKQIACGDSHCLAVTDAGQVHRYPRKP